MRLSWDKDLTGFEGKKVVGPVAEALHRVVDVIFISVRDDVRHNRDAYSQFKRRLDRASAAYDASLV